MPFKSLRKALFCITSGTGLLLTGCLQNDDTATITTKTGIEVKGYSVDSVAVTVVVDGDTADHFVKNYRAVGTDNKIRWNIDAPENASVVVDARIWHQNRVVATQIYGWVAGKMPGESGKPVPAPIPAPQVLFNDTVRAYLDMKGDTRDPLWAYPGSDDGEAEITEIAWDPQATNSWQSFSDGSYSSDVDSFWIAQDYSALAVGSYRGRVRVRDGFGREFMYTRVVEVLAGPGTFVDARDGQSYRWRTIGRRDWMVQNLNYAGTGEVSKQSWCYDDSPANCARYGRLYNWDAAMNFEYTTYRGICPEGWRLPKVEDFAELAFLSDMGGDMYSGPAVSWMADSLWLKSFPDSSRVIVQGNDALGFAALPAGSRAAYGTPQFSGLEQYAGFWSGEWDSYPGYSKAVDFQVGSPMLQLGYGREKSIGLSVRCTRDRWYF